MELRAMLDEITSAARVAIDIARGELVVNERRTLTPEGFTLSFRPPSPGGPEASIGAPAVQPEPAGCPYASLV